MIGVGGKKRYSSFFGQIRVYALQIFVQRREISVRAGHHAYVRVLAVEILYERKYSFRFAYVAFAAVDRDFFAVGFVVIRGQLFAVYFGKIAFRRPFKRFGRPPVYRKPDFFGRIFFFIRRNYLFRIGAAPTVYGLIFVAAEHNRSRRKEFFDYRIFEQTRILNFVQHDEFIPVCRVIAAENYLFGVKQNIVEVEKRR